MQFHYQCQHYYLPLELNQDNGRMFSKRLPLEPMVRIPLDPMVGLPLKSAVLVPQEKNVLLPKELPLKRKEVTGLVDPR